ncbi:hypothetical protein [Mediterraneibacter glycyrrhizinilyticus]|uniref:hypothetical protein n=1 Tax=Mediterraneibacter glycyrrhizinilyticus TaxID=342942 RepID=UPI0006D1123F
MKKKIMVPAVVLVFLVVGGVLYGMMRSADQSGEAKESYKEAAGRIGRQNFHPEETIPADWEDSVTAWGQFLSKQYYSGNSKNQEENFEKQLEQTIKFYELQGYEAKEAEEIAKDYVKVSNAIYQKALEEGYQVTEREVEEKVKELRASYYDPELNENSRRQMELIISAFKNEEDYWDYERDVYQKLLVSENYVSAVKKEFWETHPGATYNEWEQYFEDWKATLAG